MSDPARLEFLPHITYCPTPGDEDLTWRAVQTNPEWVALVFIDDGRDMWLKVCSTLDDAHAWAERQRGQLTIRATSIWRAS